MSFLQYISTNYRKNNQAVRQALDILALEISEGSTEPLKSFDLLDILFN